MFSFFRPEFIEFLTRSSLSFVIPVLMTMTEFQDCGSGENERMQLSQLVLSFGDCGMYSLWGDRVAQQLQTRFEVRALISFLPPVRSTIFFK